MRSSDPAGRTAGFTLIEVLCVIAILGIALLLVVSRGPARSPSFTLRSEAATVADRLGAVRGRAIATGRDVSVGLLADPVGLRFGREGRLALSRGIGVAMLTVDDRPTADTSRITFRPDGSADGGGILLANAAGRIAVRIGWLTGRITVAPVPSEAAGDADAR